MWIGTRSHDPVLGGSSVENESSVSNNDSGSNVVLLFGAPPVDADVDDSTDDGARDGIDTIVAPIGGGRDAIVPPVLGLLLPLLLAAAMVKMISNGRARWKEMGCHGR